MNPRCPLCGGTLEEVKLHGLEVLREPNAKCNKCGATTVIHWTEHRAKQKPVLNEIRAEIEAIAKDYDKFDDLRRVRGLWIALEIIDKYMAESEDKENDRDKEQRSI